MGFELRIRTLIVVDLRQSRAGLLATATKAKRGKWLLVTSISRRLGLMRAASDAPVAEWGGRHGAGFAVGPSQRNYRHGARVIVGGGWARHAQGPPRSSRIRTNETKTQAA